MKCFIMLPILALLVFLCQKMECTADTIVLCMSLILAGYMANPD